MEKRHFLIIVSIISIILIIFSAGCKPKGLRPEDEVVERIYRGTTGLEMTLMKDLPPRKIYDTGVLDIVAELENKGTSDLSGGKCMVHLHGFDEAIIRGIDKEKYCGSNLWERSVSAPAGGYDTIEFRTDMIRLPEGLDSLPQKFILTACYEYETTANPIICVDPGLYKIKAIREVCIVRDVTVSGGQGAPVAVTKVDVDMIGENMAAFKIYISNVGKGTVLRPGISITGRTAHSCPFNLEYDDYHSIDYDIYMTGGSMIKCSPERARLVDGKARIFCTFRITGREAYTTPLRIRLRYNYMDSISRDVEIIKTPE